MDKRFIPKWMISILLGIAAAACIDFAFDWKASFAQRAAILIAMYLTAAAHDLINNRK